MTDLFLRASLTLGSRVRVLIDFLVTRSCAVPPREAGLQVGFSRPRGVLRRYGRLLADIDPGQGFLG